MRLTFINGSPRGTKSNTGRLMDHFIRGFLETTGNSCDVEYLAKQRGDAGALAETFANSEAVIVGFPLYVDGMPGSVKAFFETLAPLMGRSGNPSLGFVIQCGFPESSHNRFVERYCEKLARRLSCRYLGSIVKGGCEGLDVQPAFLTDKYYEYFYRIGAEFGKTGALDPLLLEKLARPEHLSADNIAQIIPFINKALWDAQMEKNGVLGRSFDRPYEKE